MQKMCCALTKGNRNECQRPVVEGAEIALCAFHLLFAVKEAEDLGKPYLISLIQKGARE